MDGKYSKEVADAIEKIWLSHKPRQMREGYELLRQATEAGDPDAMCYLARCLMGEEFVWSGGGFPVDRDKASQLLLESVRLGSASGVLCALRTGDIDPDKPIDMPFGSIAEAYYEILGQAEEGDPFCLYMIGNVWFWGDYMLVDPETSAPEMFDSQEDYFRFAYPEAADYYQRSFEAGLSAGFGNYQTIYESGFADIDDDLFSEYSEMLADGGDPLVCNDYGKWLEDKLDDADAAFAYYRKAVELGDRKSAYNVGTCYGRGYGVAEDLDKAFEYYMLAARENHPIAQFHIGNFYFEGRGNIHCDYAQAFKWLDTACRNEDCDPDTYWRCAAELGILLQDGLGVVQDDDAAYSYLAEAEKHLPDAWEPLDMMLLNALGVAYGFGRGVKSDIERALDYFDRAIDFGSEAAAINRSRFRKGLFGFGRWKVS